MKCIVIDDEPLARQLIVSYINQVPEMECVGSFQGAIEALPKLTQQQVEVVFIDIEMPGLNGLNFIKSLNARPRVVFTTAYTEYAVDAFEIEAADYLVKPVTFERFFKTVQKLINGGLSSSNQQSPQAQSIFLKVDRRLVQVDLGLITHVEGFGDYVKVHTMTETYLSYMTLVKLEALLPSSGFVRIHRSVIVNKSAIKFIEGNFVRINGIDLPIGSTYKDALMKRI